MNVAPIDPVTPQTVEGLLAVEADLHLTLTMPTHRAGSQGLREDGIRFRNLIDRAEKLLKDHGITGIRLQSTFAPLKELEKDEPFWQRQSEALTLFLAPPPADDAKAKPTFRTFRLPETAPEHVAVGDRFEVLPLVPMTHGGRFFVLAVSQNKVRLLEGTRQSVQERKPDSLPDNLRDALNIDEYQGYLGLRQTKAAGAGREGGQAVFHGHGAANQSTVKEQELTEYFRRIGDGLEEFFRDPTPREHNSEPVPPGTYNPPVVFAGVDYLFPMLKEAWDYKNLLGEAIHGNVDELPAAELHAKAWPLVEAFFKKPVEEQRTRFLEEKDSSVTSTDLGEILEAAKIGRVETLFVAEGERVTGTIAGVEGLPPAGGDTAPGTPPDSCLNLLSVAAGETLKNSGRAFVVPRDMVPNEATVAATFRYPLQDPAAKGTSEEFMAGSRGG